MLVLLAVPRLAMPSICDGQYLCTLRARRGRRWLGRHRGRRDLRHAHATLALQVGVHPRVVSERLGHATASITRDTCSHTIPALQEEAAALIAGLVFAGEQAAGAGYCQAPPPSR